MARSPVRRRWLRVKRDNGNRVRYILTSQHARRKEHCARANFPSRSESIAHADHNVWKRFRVNRRPSNLNKWLYLAARLLVIVLVIGFVGTRFFQAWGEWNRRKSESRAVGVVRNSARLVGRRR